MPFSFLCENKLHSPHHYSFILIHEVWSKICIWGWLWTITYNCICFACTSLTTNYQSMLLCKDCGINAIIESFHTFTKIWVYFLLAFMSLCILLMILKLYIVEFHHWRDSHLINWNDIILLSEMRYFCHCDELLGIFIVQQRSYP